MSKREEAICKAHDIAQSFKGYPWVRCENSLEELYYELTTENMFRHHALDSEAEKEDDANGDFEYQDGPKKAKRKKHSKLRKK